MFKKFLSVVLATSLVILMFSFNISAANTSIEVDPGLDAGGDIWEVVACIHEAPENIHNDEAYGIGWTKNGDIIKLVQPIDFGTGLASLKVMMASMSEPDPNSKLIFKAGETIIGEALTVNSNSWTEYVEVIATLTPAAASLKGPQVITVEWVLPDADNVAAPGRNLGIMTFEVKSDSGAAATVAPVSTVASTAAASTAATAKKATTAAVVATLKPTATSVVTPAKSSNLGLVLAIVGGVLVIGAGAAFILIKKKS